MTSRKCNINRKRKQVISEKSTRKSNVYTQKRYTRPPRKTMQIPENSKIYEHLGVHTNNEDEPIWRRLDMILAQAQFNKEANAKLLYDSFVAGISVYYPGKETAFKLLWPHIFRHIILGELLNINYYMQLSEE